MISSIHVHSPTTLADAFAILRDRGPHLHVLAGGTDLMVYINTRLLIPSEVLNIWPLDELRGIGYDGGWLRIGALTTHAQIIGSPLIAKLCPLLVEAARTIGATQTQNRGTLGGNIVNASPAGDTLPVLAAFDAELEVGSHRGLRTIPFNSFYTGYRQTRLASDELLLAVRIPPRQADEHLFFYKVGTRQAQAISKVVIATKARLGPSGRIQSIQIGLGSVGPTVIRANSTEAFLVGQTVSPAIVEQAKDIIKKEIRPITDFRSTERYRRIITANLLARFLRQLHPDNRSDSRL